MSEEKTILEKSSIYVSQFFKKKLPEWAVYHNLQHTIETVNGCLEIGKGSNLKEDDLEIVVVITAFSPRLDAIVHCPPVCFTRLSRPGGY